MSNTITQRRTRIFLTGDLSISFTVFDHHNSQVPEAAWIAFREGYRQAHGSEPASALAEYVDGETWRWDTTYTDGTVVIGDLDGPFALECDETDAQGCRIVFWYDGDAYDTGLRVWATEATLVAQLLREKAETGEWRED